MSILDRHGNNRLRDEDIARVRRALAFDPHNASAHATLGEKLAETEMLREAAHCYETAIRLAPEGPHTKRWQGELRRLEDRLHNVDRYNFSVCHRCDKDLEKKAKTCTYCGETLRMSFGQWIVKPENLVPVLKETLVAMFVAIVLLSIFITLPLEWKGCVIGATAIVCGGLILRRFNE